MFASDVDRLEAMVNINITAALRLAHAAVAGFVARGRGTLINVSSVLALAPERFNAVYSGTKSFMLNLSLALQAELASTGIRVQAVLPGATRTELWGKAGVHQHANGRVLTQPAFDPQPTRISTERPVSARRRAARALNRGSSRATTIRSWPRRARRSA
jgi:short-subunit dehydrogenase